MKLIQTERTRAALVEYFELKSVRTAQSGDTQQSASGDQRKYSDQWIDHAFLINIAKDLGPSHSLADLVKGTAVFNEPPPAPTPKSKEYLALMDRLRREQEEREYQELTGLKASPVGPLFGPGEAKEVKEEITTIFNILISGGAVAAALWYWTASWEPGSRVLLALFGAILTLVAEVVVYLGYKRRIEEARVIERRKKETKVVKQVIGPTDAVVVDNEIDAKLLNQPVVGTTTIKPLKATEASGVADSKPRKRRV